MEKNQGFFDPYNFNLQNSNMQNQNANIPNNQNIMGMDVLPQIANPNMYY